MRGPVLLGSTICLVQRIVTQTDRLCKVVPLTLVINISITQGSHRPPVVVYPSRGYTPWSTRDRTITTITRVILANISFDETLGLTTSNKRFVACCGCSPMWGALDWRLDHALITRPRGAGAVHFVAVANCQHIYINFLFSIFDFRLIAIIGYGHDLSLCLVFAHGWCAHMVDLPPTKNERRGEERRGEERRGKETRGDERKRTSSTVADNRIGWRGHNLSITHIVRTYIAPI